MDGSSTLLPMCSSPGVGDWESGDSDGQDNARARPLAGYWLKMMSLAHARSLPFPSSDGDLSETQRSINPKPNRTKCYGITNMETPDENNLGGISEIFLISSVIYETQIAKGKE